jgi:hypothetical protein
MAFVDTKNQAILKKLGLDTVGTIDVLNERIGELDDDEIRFLMTKYNVSLSDLVIKMWRVYFAGQPIPRRWRKVTKNENNNINLFAG